MNDRTEKKDRTATGGNASVNERAGRALEHESNLSVSAGTLLNSRVSARRVLSAVFIVCSVLFASCAQFQKPETEPFFAETQPPEKQEFRWSNGKAPRSFDPARAAAAPETDIVRSLFDGLTDLDPKTLEAVPAIAEKWTASEDKKTWTFYLRGDAKWSNGQPVTAADFVRSWKRLGELGDRVAYQSLLKNIQGFPKTKEAETPATPDFLTSIPESRVQPATVDPVTGTPLPTASPTATPAVAKPTEPKDSKLGFAAEGERILKVTLNHPDEDFPKLVAHPMFRPVFGDGDGLRADKPDASIVTNGAFRIASLGPEGVTLDRSETYWNSKSVKLDRVRFVPAPTAERALEAYRTGVVDAVTNADFSPVALKLLEPYEDFRRTTFSALNFYEFNTAKAPFNDRRVRQALAIAIDRENLAESEMGGTSRPATGFLPFGSGEEEKLTQDREQARKLLDEAGFPNGKDFPVVRLLVNRNDAQQRIARAVARMWKQNLSIDTAIIVLDKAELETAKAAGDYDAIRRGIVLPTADETANFLAIFHPDESEPTDENLDIDGPAVRFQNDPADNDAVETRADTKSVKKEQLILTEEDALYEVRAIPLYFPTSYSLVKPYVKGFDTNSLDAPSLRDVEIDNNWRRK